MFQIQFRRARREESQKSRLPPMVEDSLVPNEDSACNLQQKKGFEKKDELVRLGLNLIFHLHHDIIC